MAEVRKYFVKREWIFNLESMDDKLFCIYLDLVEDRLQFPLQIAGKTIKDFDDLDALRDECDELEWVAKSGKVTGKEYGRIKEIAFWRANVRYTICMENGMSERDAGMCFQDM